MNQYSKVDSSFDKSGISKEEIEAVVDWYLKKITAKSKLKKAFYKNKGKRLRKKMGWKFYAIMQEIGMFISEERKEKGA